MKNIVLITIFSLINFIAWNYIGILFVINTWILFIIIERNIDNKLHIFMIILFATFFFFNISVTFWLYQVNFMEGLGAIVIHSIFMLLVALFTYLLYHLFRLPIVSFILLWIVFEQITNSGDIALNWLTIGNVLGNQPYFAQWYSLFGIIGGSFWFLTLGYLVNISFKISPKRKLVNYLLTFLLLVIPIIYSVVIYYYVPLKKSDPIHVLVYNPEKKDNVPYYTKTKQLYNRINHFEKFDFLVTPELFYSSISIFELENGKQNIWYNQLFNENRDLKIFLGAEIINANSNRFNTVVLKTSRNLLIRTKKKYIPFREYTPQVFSFAFGSTYYKRSTKDDNRQIIEQTGVFPALCNESLFSGFVSKNSINSEVIFVLASEKFFNDSYFGKKQYLNIVRLRAIENKRNILKCSNGGISCVINEKGGIEKIINKEAEIVTLYKIKENTLYQLLNSL